MSFCFHKWSKIGPVGIFQNIYIRQCRKCFLLEKQYAIMGTAVVYSYRMTKMADVFMEDHV